MQRIAIANESTVVTDAQVQAAIAAMQVQVDRDFAPVWLVGPVELFFLPKGHGPGAGVWELVIADTSDQAGALGYHETTEWDEPIGFVFAKSTIDDGLSWTITFSHELLEMLVDPRINTITEADNADGSIVFYMKEVCDAVEDDSFGYDIDGILVSDFVTQNWFDPMASTPEPNRKYDFKGHVAKPFELLTNGYIGVLDIAAGPQWTQLNGELSNKTEAQAAPQPMHRRARRMLGHQNWKKSEPRKTE